MILDEEEDIWVDLIKNGEGTFQNTFFNTNSSYSF